MTCCRRRGTPGPGYTSTAAGRTCRCRGQRRRGRGLRGPGRSAPVQPLVGEVSEDEPVRQRQVRLPAILVHPGPGIPWHREQITLGPGAVRPLAHHGYPAALLRPRLLPPHPGGVDDRERQADLLTRHVGTVDRGGPFAIDVRLRSHSHTDIMPDPGTESTGQRCPLCSLPGTPILVV